MFCFAFFELGKKLSGACMDVIKKTRSAVYVVNLFALLVFIVLLTWSLICRDEMPRLFANVSYYIILILVAIWGVQAVLLGKVTGFSSVRLLKLYWPGILIAFGLTCAVFLSVKVGFKTLSDETNMLSVSRSMSANKTVMNCTMGKFYYGNLNCINEEIEKRPLVFPFLVNILHTLTGFRYQNAFALNFLIMFIFLAGIYIASRKLLDVSSAIAAMFLILSYPVFTIYGTSAGFDLFNSVFFILLMAAVYYFIRSPSSESFAFLFASLLVFANIRYESIVFLFLLPVLVLPKIKWQYFAEYSYLFSFTPLLLLPYIWQRILTAHSLQNPKDVAVFSFSAFAKNIQTFFSSITPFRETLPYAGILTAAGIIIFAYLLAAILAKKILFDRNQRYFAIVLFISVIVSSALYFSHFFGIYTHPSSARFFITLSIIFALSPIALRIIRPGFVSGQVLLLLSVLCFSFYHPVAVEGRFINALTLNRKTEHCLDFLSKLNDRNILIIDSRPGQCVAIGYGAVDFNYADKSKDTINLELKRHLYSRLIVFQDISYENSKPTMDTVLNSDYKTNTLYEIQTTATEFLRISEVKLSDKLSQ
jgi:hypothetical protein